ncbi:MAG TPA: hypothetical protein DCL44_06715 [Elusimicrobia bacterium]|nr:hypothetical protein [Elusimicrobiota bacterium]
MTDKLIKRLFLKILLFQLVFLGSAIFFSIAFTAHFKYRLGNQLMAAFRNDLLMGDTRTAMLELPGAIRGDFTGVKWIPSGPSQAFSIPENIYFSVSLVYSQSVVPIYFDEKRIGKCGELVFYYYRWTPIMWALIVWSLLFVVSIPVWLREKKKIVYEYALSVKAEINESRANISAQVAHDIRSPLTALDAALKNVAQLPEEQRIIVRHAVNRIRDIANNLLEKNWRQSKTAPAACPGVPACEPLEVCLLSSLVDPVITEKRLQSESKPGINIDFELTAASYGLFAKIQPVEFKRLVSNLVNNAVEVLGDKGAVNVGLAHEDENIILTVADKGKGIPPEILAKLGQRGETHGKARGSGLGLFHARTTAENWGGSLGITSELGKGTTVTVKLPTVEPPAWFVSRLELPSGKTIVVMDDDESIHQVWRGRFESARVKEQGIEVYHYSEPGKLRGWFKGNTAKAEDAVYLFDYELLGHKETGLSLAEELGLGGKVILVTSRYEEKRIMQECERLKIRMIPKGLAGLVPITAVDSGERIVDREETVKKAVDPTPASGVEVLIDDDALVQMTWKMSARANGITLKAFKAPAEFLASLETFPKNTPIYVDSELGEGIKGEDIAKIIYARGFETIYLETGHPPEHFVGMSWIKKVISKAPPWGDDNDQ